MMYITSGVYELDEICFSAEGSFTIQVSREISDENHLREIDSELEGSFDNGVTVQVLVFKENEDDPFANLNGGYGDMISGWDELGVRVLN